MDIKRQYEEFNLKSVVNPITLREGKGVKLIDRSGKEYLDFTAGGGISILGYRILVVEDEPAIQELVAYACQTSGFEVRRSDSVRAAREAVSSELPDLALLD